VFERVTLRATDVAASTRFYDTVLATLGVERAGEDPVWADFALEPGEPPTRRLHIGFSAPTREHADAFWEAGLAVGAPDDGAPGPRPVYGPDYYGAFLLDPDGNSAEAVHHDTVETPSIDHLWIRVADVAAARATYLQIGETAGFELRDDTPERVQFARPEGAGSFSFVAGDAPTERFRMAFPGGTVAEID